MRAAHFYTFHKKIKRLRLIIFKIKVRRNEPGYLCDPTLTGLPISGSQGDLRKVTPEYLRNLTGPVCPHVIIL